MSESSSFIIPFGLISREKEPLDFVSKELESKGWRSALDLKRRSAGNDYACSFWVPSGKLGSFKKDVETFCIPFGLSQEHYSNYILLGDRKGVS